MDENKDIGQLISGELDSSPTTRQKYSHDASIFEVAPSAVIYPKNVSDLKALVHYLTTQKKQGKSVSLTARNGGTCMSGGPLTESYVLDMSRHFNHIGSVNTHAKTVWVQGGVMHIDLEKAVHPKGLYFAPYTSSRDICGIGGMIGNNASGERSIKYGATSKNVEKIHVLLSDGNKYEFGPLTAHQHTHNSSNILYHYFSTFFTWSTVTIPVYSANFLLSASNTRRTGIDLSSNGLDSSMLWSSMSASLARSFMTPAFSTAKHGWHHSACDHVMV
jgi:hypothetical protein